MKYNIFKIVIYLSAIIFADTFYAKGDTIYTRGGQPIEIKYMAEASDYYLIALTQKAIKDYPQATKISNASTTYNCHSYAWNISDGGRACWMNQIDSKGNPNIAKYWTNDYYTETTEVNAVKIFYYNSDHSAVASNTVSGMYESKWGSGPLMRHAPGYGPYLNMDQRKYYAHFNTPNTPVVFEGLINCSLGTGPLNVGVAADYTVENYSSQFYNMRYSIESSKGDDSVELGNAVINNVLDNGINVTFTRQGLYEMYIRFYDKSSDELVAEFWYEPAIEE